MGRVLMYNFLPGDLIGGELRLRQFAAVLSIHMAVVPYDVADRTMSDFLYCGKHGRFETFPI